MDYFRSGFCEMMLNGRRDGSAFRSCRNDDAIDSRSVLRGGFSYDQVSQRFLYKPSRLSHRPKAGSEAEAVSKRGKPQVVVSAWNGDFAVVERPRQGRIDNRIASKRAPRIPISWSRPYRRLLLMFEGLSTRRATGRTACAGHNAEWKRCPDLPFLHSFIQRCREI